MRSYKIKQARLTSQVPGWTNAQDIVNVCETHAAMVDRDRSCCVDQCPIIVSEFSLPTILHRPLPFRLKEGTPHRYLCLGHNLRYIDTLRKPMAASAVSDAINNSHSSSKKREDVDTPRSKATTSEASSSSSSSKKEKKDGGSARKQQKSKELKEEEGDGGEGGEGSSAVEKEEEESNDDKSEEDEGDEEEEKSEESESGEKKKEARRREKRKVPETEIDKV